MVKHVTLRFLPRVISGGNALPVVVMSGDNDENDETSWTSCSDNAARYGRDYYVNSVAAKVCLHRTGELMMTRRNAAVDAMAIMVSH